MSEKKNNPNSATTNNNLAGKNSITGGNVASTATNSMATKPTSASTSKPITNSIDPNKIENPTEKKDKGYYHWLKKSIYLIIALLIVVVVVIVIFDNNFLQQNSTWIKSFNNSSSTTKQASSSLSQNISNDSSAQNILQLQRQLQELEAQLATQFKEKSANQSNQDNKLSSMIALVNKHNQQQQQQMAQLNKQVNQFTVLINRWKKRLADPDLLVDNIYNHLQLIQSQMTLNYAPQMLAQQLDEVDKLVAELNTDELNTLRLELQSLARKLDLKLSVPIDAWLREVELAEQLIPLWLQQREDNAEKNTISLSESPLPTVPKNDQATADDRPTKDEQSSFFTTLQDFVSERLDNAFSISKKPAPNTPNQLQKPINFALTDEQISRYLKSRFELIKLSILSRNWDTLRQQSIEMNLWLSEHLSIAQKSFNQQLAMMSQYKPKFVNQSLSRAISILHNYRQSLSQKALTDNTVIVNDSSASTPTLILPSASSPTTNNNSTNTATNNTTNTSTP